MLKYTVSALAILISIFAISTPPAYAQDGKIMVADPWARATMKVSKSGAAYLMIHNSGTSDDTLLSVSSDVAKMAELHNSSMVDGIMKMKKLGSVSIPAGQKVSLKPGSNHIMFMGMKKQLIEGEMFPLTLTFEHAGAITVKIIVMSMGAKGGMDMNHDASHDISHGTTMEMPVEMPAATTN